MVTKKKEAVPLALKKDNEPLEVSQSVLSTWRRCHRQYDYRYRQLLKRKRPRVQLVRGSMVGECLDLVAERRNNPKTPAWKTVLEKYEKQYKSIFFEEREYYGDILGEVGRIITRYEAIYATDGFTYLPGKDGKPYEIHLELELTKGITFVGHIDKMPQDKHGRVWNLDHKTAKSIPDAEHRFADLQQVFYVWAAPLSGYPKLTGVIWDYLRTKPPAIPEVLKNGELTRRKNIDTDYDTYLGAIKANGLSPNDYGEILNDLKSRGHSDYYQRITLPGPPKPMIQSTVDDAISTAIEIKKLGGVSKVRSMNRMTCKMCEYFEICQAELRGLDSDFIRKTEYQVNESPRHDHSKYGDGE